MGHLQEVFAITRPPLSHYAIVSQPSVIVEAYHSSAGQMNSRGALHRISVNRTAHGRYSFRLGESGRTHTVARRRDMLCLQPAGVPLFVDGDAADYISIFLAPEISGGALQSVPLEEMDGLSLLVAADRVTLHLALALAAMTRQPQVADPLVAEQLGTALAVCVARLLAQRPSEAAPQGLAISPQRLRRVLDYIEASLGERNLSLAEIAAVAHLSPFHFSRAFKSATGTAPHRFVVERRVDRAKVLLADPNISLAEIAATVGFANQAHFSTMFRRFTSMSPRQYRQGL
ncbi:MAG TPA: AraC family transcriptional regulator [Dongiaceae bacterium]|jgi:AraC family transcriptional regulator|nr:AraC family transcriptional regulator [Dongiaceae bacterium]